MNQQEARELAAKIAGLLVTRDPAASLSGIHARLSAIDERLDRLESSPVVGRGGSVRVQHPSLDKLNIAEAIADSIFAAKEKACTFEPSKACDHCSMCNSRGF